MPFKNLNSPESIASARRARRKHYENNKEQYYRRNREKKDAMRAHLRTVKDVPCMDCGMKYPYYVMDLDHREPSKKSGNINTIMTKGSWKKFLVEIDKCDVVCANCHRERTWKKE
jgi:hypothetical protein